MTWLMLTTLLFPGGIEPKLVLTHYDALKSRSDELTMGDMAAAIARDFLGKPYKAKTLEKEGEESLVVNVSVFDCFTFIETTLALTCAIKNQMAFEDALRNIRYRNGVIEGYSSRLHYTVDWAYNNQKTGLIKDVTQTIGGVPWRKTIHFMTTHRHLYSGLTDDKAFHSLQNLEKAINSRQHYYLPKDRVAHNEHLMQEGDLIACTTAVEGLDVSHVGMAVRVGQRIHLLHASESAGKVVISDKPLSDYIAAHKNQTGVMVFRLKD